MAGFGGSGEKRKPSSTWKKRIEKVKKKGAKKNLKEERLELGDNGRRVALSPRDCASIVGGVQNRGRKLEKIRWEKEMVRNKQSG